MSSLAYFDIYLLTRYHSESPRWLISKNREEEAFQILATYHAEGDRESEFVKTEFAQIRATLQIEMENDKKGWGEMFKTPGMRRRVIIASFLGLFTQWSGNNMIRWVSSPLYTWYL